MTNSTLFLPVHTIKFTMFIVAFQVIFGWITNLINIYVLTRPNLLRASACTHYFLALAILAFIYTFIGPFLQFIHLWYPLQASIPIVGCPVLAYLKIFLPFEITTLLVMASWDRYCASSTCTKIRSWSSISIARKAIPVITIVLGIALSPYLRMWHANIDQGVLYCALDLNNMMQLITLCQAIIFNFFCPLAMSILGLLTIRNIHQQRNRSTRRIIAMNKIVRRQQTEGEICWMLLLQVGGFLVLNLPLSITYTCVILIPSFRTHFFYFLIHIFYLLYQCTHFLNFFLYIMSGTVYRREVLRMLTHLMQTFRNS